MSERPLPSVSPESGAGQPPIEIAASSARLVATLAIAGAAAGLLIVLVFQWANPQIEAYRAKILAEAVIEVLGGPDHYETIFLENDRFTSTPQSDTTELERIYIGYDVMGQPVGVAVAGAEAGFQDIVSLMFGYDPASGTVLGMKVMESKETPGLGDKILKDSTFIREFIRVATPLLGVKKGRERDLAEEVVMITGATISSRVVIDIINHRIEELGPTIGQYWSESVAAVAATDAPRGEGR